MNFQKSRIGFSLIEILIVLALIALLAGVVVTNFTGIFGGAQDDVAETFVDNSLDPALLAFYVHTRRYPSTSEGIKALIKPPSKDVGRWKGPYIDSNSIPLDPWGNPYQYRFPGTKNKEGYDLFSMGEDGVESSDDIGNWD